MELPTEDGPTPAADEAPVAADDGELDEPAYTIDELAARSGVPSRTIRFYQSKGTLPPPVRRGRVAYYGHDHLDRLRIIGELQDRGLQLDAIRDALRQVTEGGDSLQQWLGVSDRLQAPWSDDRPVVLSEEELLERLGPLGDRPGILGELQRQGTVTRQGNSRPAMFVVPSPALLDLSTRLDAAGLDAETAFEAGEVMRTRLAKMADELVRFFADRAGHGFGRSGEPDEIAAAFEALRPAGMQAVQVIFAQEMERSLRQYVESGGPIRTARRRQAEADAERTGRR
ncbi:MAG: MerR family transcriptional regulator [Acidimicrobiales bacterium]|nr:MerR family transcriptional regulator [Acidimicrobiales bacterium]